MTCDNCGECRTDLRQGWCFKCRCRTVGFTKGQLVNNLHPDLTIRESAKKVYDDGVDAGLDPVPQATRYRWV